MPKDLGISSRNTIRNGQITASSHQSPSPSFDPWKGRLNNTALYWRPSEDTFQGATNDTHTIKDVWIQVDFIQPVLVTGIQTQGSGSPKFDRWVTMLQIQTGYSENLLTYILDDENPMVIPH